ncbi:MULTISPECIES: hypothetical protein [Chromohalobacter]|uniref:hypothetical protein n=1 Tax=Chromohalobacter TaxID=42054 RepID=UPI001FFD1EA5|nr:MULTISPECIES: hypothetical protein [Chromohalobacter]MCK2044908.1 hypothetical protein [Chromohalobacter moromii]MCT8467895.1 hypothetical protein [Chromohalobacter canadensis]MCT8470356.1 hypothetical protein [Chromohalobacter canadensis]MCT8498392.1 hypothetical protein [Chromohalobacter canadensis]
MKDVSSSRDTTPRRANKLGCLGLIVGAIAFIVVVYAIIIYFISQGATPEDEAGEERGIAQCWQSMAAPEMTDRKRRTTEERCQEMTEQFELKYGHPPSVTQPPSS